MRTLLKTTAIVSCLFATIAKLSAKEEALEEALSRAGKNESELRSALEKADPARRDGLVFLIEHMPERDLKSLTADYLLENLDYAYKAREEAAWGKALSEELFLNDVLPYASINETRDQWRKDFYEKFSPMVKDCKTPGEAAQVLNRDMWKVVKVGYHATKRPKPDQSPYESMDAGYASCSGLSVLLIDACRAVGVPARFVGIPQWANKRGNHSWVEVWDGSDWQFTGACEYNKNGLGKGWFAGDASKAVSDKWQHSIYASSWKDTGMRFPLVWNLKIDYVKAENVTDRYTKKKTEGRIFVQVFEKKGGKRLAVDIEVFDGEKSILKARTKGVESDNNDMLTAKLKGGKDYEISISGGERRKFKPSGKEDEQIEFYLHAE